MRSSQSDAGGFIMVVLLIVMGITAVWMAADLPAWKQQATREKEAELLFRGQQYVRALRLYQQRNGPQTAPPDLDALVTGKFLRKKFKDPITNDDFEPVMNSTAPTAPGQATPGSPTPGRVGSTPVAQPQAQAGRGATPAVQAPAGQSGRAGGSNAGTAFGGTIAGVRSKSTAASIMQYLGATHYNEWQFVYVASASAAGPQGGAGRGGPGAPGQQGGPGGFSPIGGGRGGQPGGGPGGVQGPGRGGAAPAGGVPTGAGRGRGGF